MKVRKRPVVVDAVQFQLREYADNPLVFDEFPDWLKEAIEIKIKTLEGDMLVGPGGWIIRGINGEIYPCKHGIFVKTYEKIDL